MAEAHRTDVPGPCLEPGCDKPRAKNGWDGGKQRYGRWCSPHKQQHNDPNRTERRRAKYGWTKRQWSGRPGKYSLRKGACEQCGWDAAPCDLHRIVPGGPYTPENTITLCPNCHRIETLKQIK